MKINKNWVKSGRSSKKDATKLEELRGYLCRLEDLIYEAHQNDNYTEEEMLKNAYDELEKTIKDAELAEDQEAEAGIQHFRQDQDSLFHIST